MALIDGTASPSGAAAEAGGAGLVVDAAGVAEVARAIAAAPVATFDLEFDSRATRVPVWCLLQVSWTAHPGSDAAAAPAVAIAVIDPTVVDAAPVIDALVAHPCVIAHAPRQDLGILAAKLGPARAVMPGLVDTQLMAAFAGLGEQLGLAGLAQSLLGVSLAKDQQFTQWQQRPLTAAQLAYAEADVSYLPAIYAALADRLGPRLAWAREETAEIARDALAASAPDLDNAWRDVGGLRGLDGDQLGAAQAIARWRLETSIALDKPVGQVLAERAVVELARERPRDADDVRAVRGIGAVARAHAEQIAAAIAGARPIEVPRARAASPRAQRWADVLLAIAQLVADQSGIAARLLATRGEAEKFARAVDEGGEPAVAEHPALATWRRAVLGEAWLGFLAGRLAVVGDASSPRGLALVVLPK